MARLWPSRLHRRLVLLASLAAVPALAAVAATRWIERRHALEHSVDDSLKVARLAAAEQASVLSDAERLLRTLSAFRRVLHDPVQCDAVLADVWRDHPNYGGLLVVNRAGEQVCSANPSSRPESVASRTWFTRALTARRMVIGDMQVSRVGGKPYVVAAYPLLDASGTVEHVLAAGIVLEQLSTIASTAGLPPTAILMLLDRNRTILMRHPDASEWVGKKAPGGGAMSRIQAGAREDIREDVGVDGVPRLWVTVPVEASVDAGLVLAMGVAHTVAFAGPDSLLKQSVWLLIFVVAAGIAVGLGGGDLFIVRPIRTLTEVTRRLAAGELSARAQLARAVPGLRELTGVVNEMATALEVQSRVRDEVERQLRASEERYRVPFENTPHPSWLYDVETLRFIEVNRAACEHYGYTRDEFLQLTIADILTVEDAPAEPPSVATGVPAAFQQSATHRKKDGTRITMEISSMAATIGGRPAQLVLANDVTARQKLEEQLRQTQKMDAVGRLAGGIAHDFNNLLTIILGSTHLLLESGQAESSMRRELDQIRQAATSAASLTQQLLAFSRKQVLQPQALDLNAAVSRMSGLLRRVVGEDVEFASHLAPSLHSVYADPTQIEQVLLNLAVNAREAMPNGGTLTIETSHCELGETFIAGHPGAVPGRFVKLVLSDTGVGMDEQTRVRLFEPFFTTKDQGKGTGLGLATVYGIVKQTGGFISVDSARGAGTAFAIYLPYSAQQPAAAENVTPASGSNSGDETILVVEDQNAVRAIARRILASRGYAVIEASGAAEALDAVRQYGGRIQLVLTDIVMPEMNGIDLAKRILSEQPGVRVLYMSGYTDRDVFHDANLRNDLHFIEKPFTPQRLVEKVRTVLGAVAVTSL